MMHEPRALVVLSGGQDSTTCLYWAMKRYEQVHAVTFDYAQRHAREIEAALQVGKLAGVASHEVISMGPILKGRSPLTDHSADLEQYSSPEEMARIIGNRVEKTFVPMRNPLFAVIAANRAACLGDTCSIILGVCQDDNANYPDCRGPFVDVLDTMIGAALGSDAFRIETPLLYVPKPKAILAGLLQLGCYPALGYSHTSYDGSYPPSGADHATVLRASAFAEAGVPDPLIIRAYMEKRYADIPAAINDPRVLNHIPDTAEIPDQSIVLATLSKIGAEYADHARERLGNFVL